MLAAIACAALLLALTSTTWVSASVPDPLTPTTSPLVVTGTEAAPLVSALALVAAAAAVAISTARGALLVLASALLALAGAGALVAALTVVADPASVLASAAESASGTTTAPPTDVSRGWAPLACLPVALALTATGFWALAAGRRWTATSRFERSAAAPVGDDDATPQVDDVDTARAATEAAPGERSPAAPSPRLWDELSSGEDPTR